MATSKQSFVRAAEPQRSVSAQRDEEMHVKAPLTTMYVHTVPVPGLQPYTQTQPGALQDATVVPLFLPRMSSNQTPSLTLHLASTAALQQQGLGVPASSPRPKSVGKHVCPHCGKDCLKPSVLEKHLRCHTGERPYPCTTCGISFKTQSNLYKHKRTQAHARLSSESEKGTFSSQESTESSKDTCVSPRFEMHAEDSADVKRIDGVLPVVSMTNNQAGSADCKTESGKEWALHKAAMVGLSTTPALQDKLTSVSTIMELPCEVKNTFVAKQTSGLCGDGHIPVTPNRTPLQRQEALFSKPWESPMSRGKSQSHDSTDSGFSDSSEHHSSSSPGASLQDPSMESLVETAMEHQEPGASQAPSEMTPDDPNSKVSIQEKRKLEERISKLIYENSVLVEDKQLDHVRPRKTVLSKQGSIDLPVPYTYKDSFHFEIRSSKHISSSQKNDRGGAAIYSSVPAQHSTSLEHAPLTRSSSLPFTVGGRSTDGVINQNISRRCSAGYVYPTRSSDQLAPSHRPLVRQGAVDCLPSAEGSPVERSSISSLSSDGDSTDIGTEPSKGNYRKKSRKFDYTKWHTYKGGTFRKLYNTEKDCPLKTRKTTLGTEKTESLEIQISQQADNASSVSLSFTSCSVVCLPQTGDISLAQKPNQVISSYVLLQSSPMKKPMQEQQILNLQNDLKGPYTSSENSSVQGTELGGVDSETQHTDCHIPSERKKQRTGQDVHMLSISRIGQANTNLRGFVSQPLLSTSGTHDSIRVIPTEQSINVQNLHQQESYMHRFSNPRQFLSNTPSPAFCLINMSGTSGLPSGSTSSPTIPEAKTSFPPKYQLKIPCSTDGVSTSCSGSTLAHNTSSPVPAHKQSNETTAQFNPEISSPSSTQCQDASIVTTFEQSKHDALCATTSMPMLLVSCSGENEANASSKTQTQFQPNQPTSVSLVSPILPLPVQHQVSLLQSDCTTDALENQSTDLKAFTSSEHVTSLNTMSTRSHCSESSEPIQIYSSATVSPTVKNHPASPVIITGKAPGPTVYTQSTVQENILNSTSKMDTGDFLSEGKVLLLNSSTQSQDTFYVRTADLQIVMQLISDEQLALIEPHIETPDFKTESSASYGIPSSTSSTNQTFLSQEVYKQSPKDDVTSVCGAQETVNIVEMETTENTVSKSCGTAYSERNTQNGSSLHPLNDKHDVTANSCPQWVKSMSHQHTKFLISADCSTNPTGQLCESHMIPESPQERKSAAFDIITESCHKQVAGDKLNDSDSVDNSCSRREYGKEPQNCSVHCVDLVISSDHTSVVTLSHDQTTTEMNEKYDIVTNQLPKNELKTLMCSNNTETINITEPEEPNKAGHITSSEDGERNQTERTTELRISTESQQMQKVLSSTLQPSQNKPCWAACAISDSTTRETRACGTGKLSCTHGVLGNETFCPGQTPTQYQIQQAFGLGPGDFGNNSDKVKTYCPMLNRTPKCILEGSTKCGNVNTHHANLDTFTGLGEGGTLESQRFPKDPGSEKKESVPKEPGSGGGEWESQADMNNTCQARKNNEKQDKRKEEAKSRVEHQTTTQLHSHPPQEIMNVLSSEPTHHDKFSISNNPAPSVCTNIVSQTCQSLGDCDNLSQARDDSKNEIFVKSTCQDTSQRETASSGSDQRVVLSSTDSSVANPKQTCRHLLVHPLLVNAMQKEVLKDPPTRSATTHWTYSKCTQAQVLSSQNKMTHVLKHHCSSSKTEVVNTTIPSLSCAGPSSCETRSNPSQYMYSQALNTNQICPPATYSNPTETKSFYLGNNYMEHEDSNSSSDDEQKLVIELE